MAADLERLVKPLSRGDPISPLRWTCKGNRTLAATLITGAARDEGSVAVSFDGEEILYNPDELDQLSLAYALSVHKSQGSE